MYDDFLMIFIGIYADLIGDSSNTLPHEKRNFAAFLHKRVCFGAKGPDSYALSWGSSLCRCQVVF